MNTDASRSLKATFSSSSTNSSASRVSGLGILSPRTPSPEFTNIPTQQPQFVSAIGRVSDLSPSPPDYYASAPSFAALTASSSATGPLPAPIFATQRQTAPVVPFIPPTPASATCASFQPPAGQYPTRSAQIGYSLPTFSESPSVNLAQRVFYIPGHYANAGLIRQAVSQLSLGRTNTHPDERETYASDLVEQMIEALFRLWPDHRESNEPSSPVMAQAMISQTHPSGNLDPRLRNVQQQATPESSPDLVMDKNRKRKRVGIMEDASRLHKRRSVDTPGCSIGAAPRSGLQVSLPPVNPTNTMPMPHQATSSISLRVFCWELLRRSKTTIPSLEVALCYLDVVGDKVRELRECYMNGGAGFDCGPEMLQSRRRVFDEALRDRGRIVSRKEHLAQEKQKKSHFENLQRQSSWRPLSPPDLDAMSTDTDSRAGTCSFSQSSTITDSGDDIEETPEVLQLKREILSSHPLLDPRRTLLAALVLATKFLQDRAYSNRAWAKLSGLPGHEVGRCERALGGALGWRLWVGKSSHSGSTTSSPSHDGSPSFAHDHSDLEDPEVDDGSSDPTFLRLLDAANKAASSGNSTQQNRSNSLAMESVHPVPQSRSMTWPSLPSAFTVTAPPPHPASSLGDYSSILSSAQSFDSSSATATPLPIPPPPNATVMDPSGAWYSSYVHPQFLVDHKTATSIEDAKRILGEDGIDQYGQMAGLTSSSPMQHPVFASSSQPASVKLGGADCASPSTPPYVQAWNNAVASSQATESSDIDQLKAFSDYWINGDGLIPATYVSTSPLTPTSAETFTQRDARQDTLVASTPGSTIFGFGCPSRSSTLVADPVDQVMSDSTFNMKGKTDDMMAVLTNDLVSTTISSKSAGLWFVQPPNEQPQLASMI